MELQHHHPSTFRLPIAHPLHMSSTKVDQDRTSSTDFETVIAIAGHDLQGETENGKSAVEEACSSCSIKMDCNNQRVCRICHLSSKESGVATAELMEIGCGCKGEVGEAHQQCAEAWFRVKGNRLCEICGEAARNVVGVCDDRFMVEWNEGRWIDRGIGNSNRSDGSRRRCLQGQPFCNLLMACLVIAFILPWFFRMNLF